MKCCRASFFQNTETHFSHSHLPNLVIDYGIQWVLNKDCVLSVSRAMCELFPAHSCGELLLVTKGGRVEGVWCWSMLMTLCDSACDYMSMRRPSVGGPDLTASVDHLAPTSQLTTYLPLNEFPSKPMNIFLLIYNQFKVFRLLSVLQQGRGKCRPTTPKCAVSSSSGKQICLFNWYRQNTR